MIFKKGDFINDCEILEIHNNPNKNKKDWVYFNRKSGWYFMMCNDYSVRK